MHEIEPIEGLPDMVFAANGATVAKNRVYGARFLHPERAAEGPAYSDWFRAAGYRTRDAEFVNEGEGDLLVAGNRLLAGTGFRTDPPSSRRSGRDPCNFLSSPSNSSTRATTTSTPRCACSAPTKSLISQALSARAVKQTLRELYPDAIIATADDAAVLGLNGVSDGHHVVLPVEAVELAATLACAWLPTGAGASQRVAQSRRRTEVLHVGVARMSGDTLMTPASR